MIKMLQKKFIVTAMSAVTLLLVVLLGVLNAVNLWVISQENDSMLTFLSGIPVTQGFPFSERFAGHPAGRPSLWGHTFTEDDALAARFFVAYFDEGGEIERVDIGRISSVTEEEAAELALRAYEKGAEGHIGNFQYTSAASVRTKGTVYTFLNISSAYASITRIIILSLAAGAVCWLLMLLLVIFLSGKAIRPIAENIQRQRQFVTDAGHEIKTPLAIILANTDAMELYNGENKWSRNIRSQTLRLSGLMQNLLILARADEGRQAVNPETFDLSELLKDSIALFEEPMKQKGLTLERNIADQESIYANKEQIANLLSILIDNAVKYSAENGTVAICLMDREKQVELHIENDCEALPSCEPARLFDRFYRADTARTQKNGGYGIGLSAARAIVETCHGEITAQYLSVNRIAFVSRFPKG